MRRLAIQEDPMSGDLCPESAIAPKSIDQWPGFRSACRKWLVALERFHAQLEVAAMRGAPAEHVAGVHAAWDSANRTFKACSEDTPSARRLRISAKKKRRK